MVFEWSSLGTLFATLFFIRSLLMEFVPQFVLIWLNELMCACLQRRSQMSIVIEEFDAHGYSDTFDSVLRYLSSKFSATAAVVKVSDSATFRGYSFDIDVNQLLQDELGDVKVMWSFRVKEAQSLGHCTTIGRMRYLELTYDKALNQRVRDQYFPTILGMAHDEEVKQRSRKLYTNRSSDERGSLWSSVPFSHPSTFDTLAMEPRIKSGIMKDLTSFLSKEEHYKRVGRAWKRGYLLYGPPGTGKTSLVAAMANFLEYDVYDLELTAVMSNSQLRRLLVETKRKSVIVIEDIDRSIPQTNSKGTDEAGVDKRGIGLSAGELSLSGILNFMDGLWSSCGQERIMVVTTNHREKLDPALLRPGRLDVHVNLSYCGVEALWTLAGNYLGVDRERDGGAGTGWGDVEAMLVKAKVTPATVAEVLMGSESVEMARAELTKMLSRELVRMTGPKEE